MKNLFRLAVILTFYCFSFNATAQVIATEMSPDGVLVPRMTTAQKEAIVNTVQSLLVYDTDTKSFWYYQDMQWNELAKVSLGKTEIARDASPNLAIPDFAIDANGVMSTITLSGEGIFEANTEVKVCINVPHNYLSDINVTLVASDGFTTLDLTSGNGLNLDNYTNTCFTSTATELITSGSAPFTGNYIPETPFSNLIGQNIAGDWKLQVAENFADAQAVGTFESWSITFQDGDPLVMSVEDLDKDTKILVEKAADEDIIRMEVDGIEVVTIEDSLKTTLPISAPAFVGDGSQLTGISSGGGCPKYGDGSAGDLIISSNTNWSTTIPNNGNFMFQNLTINSGQTLTVVSGTVIVVTQNFINNGTIEVLPGIDGERASHHINGTYPKVKGSSLTEFTPYSTQQLRFITNPKIFGGGNGEDGSLSTTSSNPNRVTNNIQEGGSGGGTLVVRAGTSLVNNGTINAFGGNAIPHNVSTQDFTGAGGGGGGFIILMSPSITNGGTINVNGGNGTNPGTGDDDHAGGGGGGGLIHFISSNADIVGGSTNIQGGTPGTTPSANLGTSGADGGTSVGAGGRGGIDDPAFAQPQAGGVGVVLRTKVDPCSLSFD